MTETLQERTLRHLKRVPFDECQERITDLVIRSGLGHSNEIPMIGQIESILATFYWTTDEYAAEVEKRHRLEDDEMRSYWFEGDV